MVIDQLSSDCNLFIRGDNLRALERIREKYRGKVKLIYIDPPYNSGNTGLKYKDDRGRMEYLDFILSRAKIAKELLTDDGVFFIHCDDKEQAHLKVVLDDLFDGNFINTVSVYTKPVMGVGSGTDNYRLPKNVEYIHIFYNKVQPKHAPVLYAYDFKEYLAGLEEDGKKLAYTKILVSVGDKEKIGEIETSGTGGKQTVAVYKHKNFVVKALKDVMKSESLTEYEACKKYFNQLHSTTAAQSSVRASVKSLVDPDDKDGFYSIDYIPIKGKNKGKLTTNYYRTPNCYFMYWLSAIVDQTKAGKLVKTDKVGTLWNMLLMRGLHYEGGIRFKNGKKLEALIKRILDMYTKPGDLVLDYFAGSGTTCAVAHKMGRQWIGVELQEYDENDPLIRINNVIAGDQTGISKEVGWEGGGYFMYYNMNAEEAK